ncbi:MAG TPA: glycosyltransferase family 2 protein [Vicinamibacteria bacterium]|nr:glycosyltransferase family 2 protein [Vicinamibacteria bacterium]
MASRILLAVPAHDEEATVADLVARVRRELPEYDLLVVDDGSRDRTGRILDELGVRTARHYCNLGYGRAIQTALKYAARSGYEGLVTLDADGQHPPEQVRAMLEAFGAGGFDMLIGSRYVASQRYAGAPLGRRLGMRTLSLLLSLVTGQRVYDTTSGLKAMRRVVFAPLIRGQFLDFHAEALVYLMRLGYRVGEFPIAMPERLHGQSMYGLVSALEYPLKTLLLLVLGLTQASLARREARR